MPIRRIINTQTGPALIQEPDGVKVTLVGGTDAANIDVTDARWAELHAELKTGDLDFDTVKEMHGITGEQGD
jgi:hypothetical protein